MKWVPWRNSAPSEGSATEDLAPDFFVPALSQLTLHPSLITAYHLALVHLE